MHKPITEALRKTTQIKGDILSPPSEFMENLQDVLATEGEVKL